MESLGHRKLVPTSNLGHLVTLLWNMWRGMTDYKFPEDGDSRSGAGTGHSGDFHCVTIERINKYSLLSAQTAKLRSSCRYNWLSLMHWSFVTRSEEEGTNGGRADNIRWARFSSGLNTKSPAVTKQTVWLVSVLCWQTVKQQVIICKPAVGRWSTSRSGRCAPPKNPKLPHWEVLVFTKAFLTFLQNLLHSGDELRSHSRPTRSLFYT
jgi:hypothetical protein